jgi:hypothetical protein
MQQGFRFCCVVKIAAFLPQYEVRKKAGSGAHMSAELLVFVGQKSKPASRQSGDQNHQQGGKDAPDAAGIKLNEIKAVSLEASKKNGRNQESGDYKKISTPMKPPCISPGNAWNPTTERTAMARSPSISARYLG